jgi:serine/threonine-protein kinase
MYQIVNFVPPAPSGVNEAVPELLDYIVAKMIAKPLEERYQDAAEVARDLRECERQLSATSATGTQPPRVATGATHPPQPTLVDSSAKQSVLAQTLNRTRQADQSQPEAPAPAPHGVALDSEEATQRLAALTGAASGESTLVPQTATQAIKSIPQAPRTRWRRRDWLVVGGAALCGLIAARLIVRRGK